MEINSKINTKLKTIILVFISIQLILFFINFKLPYVGIYIENKNEEWVVKSFSYPKWAEQNHLNVGDIILEVNDVSIQKLDTITEEKQIRAAKSITFSSNGIKNNITISHLDIPEQFLTLLLFPFLYFLLTISMIFHTLKNNRFIKIKTSFVLFLMSVSLAYSSLGPSSKKDIFGSIMINVSMIASAIMLLCFLVLYLDEEKLFNKLFSYKVYIYIIITAVLLISLFENLFYPFTKISNIIILSLFGIIILLNFVFWGWSYFYKKNKQGKIILLIFIIPLFPFIFLYILPKILFDKYYLPADYSILAILLIPIAFFLLQVSDRLFEVEFYLNRFIYYLGLSIIPSLIFLFGLYLIIREHISYLDIFILWIFLIIAIVLLFYIKEFFDYKTRRFIFPSKKNLMKQLYLFISRFQNSSTEEDLLKNIEFSFTNNRNFEHVKVIKYPNDHLSSYYRDLENQFHHLNIGELHKIDNRYFIPIYLREKKKFLLSFRTHHKILSEEEIVWIELLSFYLNILIENAHKIEDLIKEITEIKSEKKHNLSWLQKLIFAKSEEEKKILAYDLHDTVLQELIQISREVDLLTYDINHENSKKLKVIQDQILDVIYEIRTYCETLTPTLLSTLGLNAELDKLIMKVKTNANFVLRSKIGHSNVKDYDVQLHIYRMVQELFNNALKHSHAKTVTLELLFKENEILIHYTDDGIGFNAKTVLNDANTIGINGLKERVYMLNGKITIWSEINKGVKIDISIPN